MEQKGSWLYWRGGGGRILTGGVELLLRARCLPSLQSQIITNYYETLHRLNPNALVTWHSIRILTGGVELLLVLLVCRSHLRKFQERGR
jgi:hypothetical protein